MEKQKKIKKETDFIEDIDYYYENGFMVLTAHFLKKRGYCCGNGCRHCPYSDEENPNYSRKVSISSRGA